MPFLISSAATATAAALPHAAAFDPVAATNAYLAGINGAARARSDAYFVGGYWLLFWGALVSVVAGWLLLHYGIVAWLSGWASRVARGHAWLRALIFVPLFVALTTIVTLPWTIYTDWARERQYDMANQRFGAWFGQWAIGAAISVVAIGLLLFALLALYRRLPRSWWAWGTLLSGVFLFVGLLISPVFIEPLFNHYTPMPASPLRSQILRMARANGVPADNILVVDASRQTKRISANVAGFGPTVRVALNDNLLQRTSPAEVRAVMGHELGHYVLGHTVSLVIAFTVLAGLELFAIGWGTPALIARFGVHWGLGGRDDPGVLAPALIVSAIVGLLMTPLFNNVTRFHESQADYFGINTARAPDGWARVTLKLSEYRKLEPSLLEEVVFYDHPSGRTRILMAMRWKAQHLGEAAID